MRIRARKRGKKTTSSLSVIVGGWCALFAAYSHVACQNSTTPTGTGLPQDAGYADSAGGNTFDSSSPITDASGPINDSGSGSGVGTFAGTSGAYTGAGSDGCGINTFTLAVGTTIVANGFGENGAVTFTLKSGSDKIAEATNLTIFGEGEHTCLLEVLQAGSIALSCTNPGGGSCGPQTFSKN